MQPRGVTATVLLPVLVLLAVLGCNPEGDSTQAVDLAAVAVATTGSDGALLHEVEVAKPVTATVGAQDAPADSTLQKCDIEYVVLAHDGRLVPDPAKYAVDGTFLYSEVYSGLTGLDPITGEVQPELAASYSVSDDGLVYTFRLREGLKFSDGTPVESSDVEFSWARALSPELRSPWSEYVLGNVVGADQVTSGSVRELDGVTIVDEMTIEVSLVAPDVEFPAKLAHRVASVLKESNVDQWRSLWTEPWVTVTMGGSGTLSDLPVGTGPLKVGELDYWDNSAVLVPNDYYWDGSPGSTGVIQRDPLVDENALAIAIDDEWGAEAGSVSVEMADPWVPRLQDFDIVESGRNFVVSPEMYRDYSYDWTEDGGAHGYGRIMSTRLPEVSFLALNSAVAPFDDVNFRRAMVAAADTRSLYYRTDSVAVPRKGASGLLPPKGVVTRRGGGMDADEDLAAEFMGRSRYAHNLSNQRIEFHWVNTFMPFDFETVSRFWRKWFGVMLEVDEGRSIGDDMHVFSMGPENVQRFNRELESGTLQLRFVEVQPTRNSPEEILGLFRNLFGPNADSPEVRELNELLDAAAAEVDAVKRAELYADIEEYILDRALAIPIAWGSSTKYELVREWISGYEPSRYPSSVFKDVVVDTSHLDYPSDRPCR